MNFSNMRAAQVEAEVAQGNYRNTTSNVIRADFKDFTTRWKMIVASMRVSFPDL